MSRCDNESARADKISSVADDLQLLLRKTLNATAGLEIVRISKGDDAGNAAADRGRQVLDGAVRECGALT